MTGSLGLPSRQWGGRCVAKRNFNLSQSNLVGSRKPAKAPFCQDDYLFDHVGGRPEQTCTIFTAAAKEGASPGTYHFYYCSVNLHAPVCSETSGPLDPAASASRWGSLGTWAVPSILLGGGTSALQHSTGHYVRAEADPHTC